MKILNKTALCRTFIGSFLGVTLLIGAADLFAQKSPTALKSKIKTTAITNCTDSSANASNKGEFTILSPTNKEYYICVANNYRATRSVEQRNKLIYLTISQIDLNFREYRRNRRYGKDSFQILMDILEIGASTAIAITNGERAKSIIAEGLTFVQGSRASVNKHLRLLEQEVLFNRMDTERSTILMGIYAKVGYDDLAYPFERAFIDLVDYYEAGTMDGALTKLAATTGAEAKEADEELRKFVAGASEVELGQRAQRIRNKMQRQLNDANLSNGAKTMFENIWEKLIEDVEIKGILEQWKGFETAADEKKKITEIERVIVFQRTQGTKGRSIAERIDRAFVDIAEPKEQVGSN